MRWSWKVGDVRGIGIRVHATFFILIAFLVLSHWSSGSGLAKTLEGVGFILALFLCVVLHELGHALAAERYGIRTRDITLLPIGGLARLERIPEKPLQEFWVALAGPAVNLLLAVALLVGLRIFGPWAPLDEVSIASGPFLQRLMLANALLAVFNLLPAFPMDGGRVLRALLATKLEYTRATIVAANVGQMMALAFGLVGVLFNPFLVLIALFVWIGAAQEASVVQTKSALAGIPITRAMITDFHSLGSHEPLARAIQYTLAGTQQDFPVVDEGRVVGVLTRKDLLAALTSRGEASPVGQAMQTDFETVDASEMFETAFARLQNLSCRTLPVLQRGNLVGLVTMENVGEFIAIQAASRTFAKAAGPSSNTATGAQGA